MTPLKASPSLTIAKATSGWMCKIALTGEVRMVAS